MLHDCNFIIRFVLPQPSERLKLRVDHEAPSTRLVGDYTVLPRERVGWETVEVPLPDENRLAKRGFQREVLTDLNADVSARFYPRFDLLRSIELAERGEVRDDASRYCDIPDDEEELVL